MKNIVQFIIDRAKERSTWLGVISLATAVGLALNPDQQNAVISLGMAAAGAIAAFSKDKAA